jgi:hypothetical protein
MNQSAAVGWGSVGTVQEAGRTTLGGAAGPSAQLSVQSPLQLFTALEECKRESCLHWFIHRSQNSTNNSNRRSKLNLTHTF